MQIICQCNRCGQRYQVGLEWANRMSACQRCGTAIQIPPAPPGASALLGPAPDVKLLEPARSTLVPSTAPAPTTQHIPGAFAGLPASSSPVPPIAWILGGSLAAVLIFALVMGVLVLRYSQSIEIVDKPAQPQAVSPAVPGPPTVPGPPSVPGPPPAKPAPVAPSAPAFPAPRVAISSQQPTAPASTDVAKTNVSPETTSPAASATSKEPLPAGWENEGRIPYIKEIATTLGPTGCPVLVTGIQVWNIADKKVVSDLQGTYEDRNGFRRLSPDGNYFAATIDPTGDSNLGVWDTRTGEQIMTVPGQWETFRHFLHLSNEFVIVGGDRKSEMEIWNLSTRKREAVRPMFLAKPWSDNTCLSYDGKYLASPAGETIQVYRVADGKAVAGMAPRNSKNDLTKGKVNTPFGLLTGMRCVAFSPDSQELAMVSTFQENRLLCWDNRGRLVYDQPFRSEGYISFGGRIEWLPNRTGWLVDNNLIDRETGRTVLSIKSKLGTRPPIAVFDDNHLVGAFANKPDEIDKLAIPWTQIRASLAAMREKKSALIAPDMPVGVRLELGDLRGDATETSQLIYTAMYNRLQRDNLKVEEGAKTFFRMRFTETAGETLPIVTRQGPFDFRGTETGRTATEARGSLVVELLIEGSEEPAWREVIQGYSSRSFGDADINDTTIRNSMVNGITAQLATLNIPYFLPTSEDLVALPTVLQ